MTNKKKLLIGVSSILVVVIALTLIITLSNNKDNVVLSDNKDKVIPNGFLTLMLEQDDGTYQKSTSNTWPEDGYAFNSNLSRCENGGELSWDRESNIVKLISNKSDKCYVYFDLYNRVQITNVNTSKTYNSITVSVETTPGDNNPSKYYFSIDDGKSYQESNTSSYTFSNLSDNTNYTIKVYVKDTAGYDSLESSVEVTTNAYVNPVVNSVSATSVSNDSITVSVSATAGTSSISRYYYSSNNGSSYSNSTSNTYTFSGLSSGTTYQIRVYVIDSNGEKSNEYSISVETDSVTYICNTGTNLATCIKNQYTSQGANGLYYHTSSLANSAGDNSYRYAGANPNNYICFGSDAATCPTDNLYRIIGVFDDEVKLIKINDIGKYYYASMDETYWDDSYFNEVLNVTYYKKFSLSWQNKISTHNFFWAPSSIIDPAVTVKQFYDKEMKNHTSLSIKIGLMYVSDYGFAASNSYWTTSLDNYASATDNNWLYLGLDEFTMTVDLRYMYNMFLILSNGVISSSYTGIEHYIRPTFYLTSSTTYVSGSGSSTDPIRIN